MSKQRFYIRIFIVFLFVLFLMLGCVNLPLPTPIRNWSALQTATQQVVSNTAVSNQVQNESALTGLLYFGTYDRGIEKFDFENQTLTTVYYNPQGYILHGQVVGNTFYFIQRVVDPNYGSDYHSLLKSKRNIFSVNLNGDNFKQIMDEANLVDMIVSPTGEELALISIQDVVDDDVKNLSPVDPFTGEYVYRKLIYELSLVNLKTGKKKMIVQDIRQLSSPKWSPDGKKMVFFYDPYSTNTGIPQLVDVQSSEQIELGIPGKVSSYGPGWSPDGKFIPFGVTTEEHGAGIYLYNVANKDGQFVTSTVGLPRNMIWSPDGNMIVFEVPIQKNAPLFSSELWVLDLTTGQTFILQEDTLGSSDSYYTVWSSDSQNIAYFTDIKKQHFILNVFNIKTTHVSKYALQGEWVNGAAWIGEQ